MTPDRAERAMDAAFGPGAWAEAGEHIDRDAELTFASAGVAGVHYARCWPCQLGGPCPGGWHTWADAEDIEHALKTGQPDPSDKRCGCPCSEGPVIEPVEPDPDMESLDAPPCPVCGEQGACGYDAQGRALIHATDDEEDDS